ncbi:agmatinase [bacterium]|nr:agmatinase [bacterium]
MTDWGGALKKALDFQVAILGVPFDEKSSYMKGPSLAPQAIRKSSTSGAINCFTESGLDLHSETVLTDLGNVEMRGDFSSVFSKVEKKVSHILGKEAMPVILGGDHSVSNPVIQGFCHKFSSLDILHFDAHPDMYEEYKGDRFSHACPFARILEKGIVRRLVQVGIRTATKEQRTKASQYNVQMMEMKDIPPHFSLEFENPLYISVDMDVLDPAFAPGVSHWEPGGLSTRQLLNMVLGLKAQIVGMDVVELNPLRDHLNVTAAAAVKIIKEVIGKKVKNEKEKEIKERIK